MNKLTSIYNTLHQAKPKEHKKASINSNKEK
jgi:hypothetical protein